MTAYHSSIRHLVALLQSEDLSRSGFNQLLRLSLPSPSVPAFHIHPGPKLCPRHWELLSRHLPPQRWAPIMLWPATHAIRQAKALSNDRRERLEVEHWGLLEDCRFKQRVGLTGALRTKTAATLPATTLPLTPVSYTHLTLPTIYSV